MVLVQIESLQLAKALGKEECRHQALVWTAALRFVQEDLYADSIWFI